MNKKINNYVNALFEPYNGTKKIEELKNDLLMDLNEKYEELIKEGKNENEAFNETIESIGEIEEILCEMDNLTHALERKVLVNFNASELKNSDFSDVTLHNGKLRSSDLRNTNFSGTDLTGSSFKTSDLQGANFNRANLTNCDLSIINLRDANFEETIFNNTNFSKSDLRGVKFKNVKLLNVNFSMVDFTNVIFNGCTFDGVNFNFTDLRNKSFDGQTLCNIHFEKVALENVSFKNATLKNVSFKPPFTLFNKYYKAIKTIKFDGAIIDKLTYIELKSLGANLDNVTTI